MKAEVVLAFIFGAVFLVALLVLAIVFPCPTSFQLQVFQTVMALAAAGVAAVIPGLLEIKSQVRKFGLRAGGALAMFADLQFNTEPG